jgi:hypothetical protein
MPCPVVEPVPEVVEAIRNEVLGGAEVEPRVDWSSVSTTPHLFETGGMVEEGWTRTFVDNALKTYTQKLS